MPVSYTHLFPLVITDEHGTILWYNSLYRELFDEEIMGEDIKDLMTDIFVDSESDYVNFEMRFKDHDYNIFTNSSEVKSQESGREYIRVFFMVDNSSTAELEKIIADTTPMVLTVEDVYKRQDLCYLCGRHLHKPVRFQNDLSPQSPPVNAYTEKTIFPIYQI